MKGATAEITPYGLGLPTAAFRRMKEKAQKSGKSYQGFPLLARYIIEKFNFALMEVIMRRVLGSAVVIGLVFGGVNPAFAQQLASPATITVTGEGVVSGVPDQAIVTLGVTMRAETAAQAMAANSEAQAKVIARLLAAGVGERDIQTSNLTLNPDWRSRDGSTAPEVVGFVADNQVTIRVRDLASLGAVLDAAIQDGANTLNGLSFGLSEPRPAMDKARQQAVADAKARADLLAQAAGVSLGKIVTISESGGYVQPAPMFKADFAEAAPVPVQGGEVATTANVTIVYEIVQ